MLLLVRTVLHFPGTGKHPLHEDALRRVGSVQQTSYRQPLIQDLGSVKNLGVHSPRAPLAPKNQQVRVTGVPLVAHT